MIKGNEIELVPVNLNDRKSINVGNIKRLTDSDVDFLRQAGDLFWEDTGSDEKLKNFLVDKNNWVYVAWYKENIVGFAFGYILDTFYSKSMCYIHSIDVAEEYKRKGFGKAIMNKIIEDCIEQGVKECFLITNKSNIQAVKLYESVGGSLLSDDDIVYGWEFENNKI